MNKKILLVEDEELISFIYKRQLDQAGYQTDIAANGTDGLGLLQKDLYDLVLLDIMLPGINGIDVLKIVKNDDRVKNIPVILLTNLAQDNIIQEGFKNGAAAYWIKANYSPDEIVAEVGKFLEKTNEQPSSVN